VCAVDVRDDVPVTEQSSPARVHFDPAEMEPGAFYRVLNSVVVPRPIAWVCSRSAEGVHNLAPHSFYTVACVDPPVVQFTSVGRKDSLRNVEETGEFTVSLTPEPLFEQVNATGTDFPRDQSEAEHAGVHLEPSEKVGALRVADSPVSVECTLHATLRLGDSTVVFGRVVHIAVHADAVRDGRPRIERLQPLARLGGNEWSTIGEVKEIRRIPYRTWSEDPAIGERLRGE
jgi:flavin reductase (DIM6/NTAB) family NADH-FMN oxidoreductase RutF